MKMPNMDLGKRLILFVFLNMQLGLIFLSLWPTIAFLHSYGAVSRSPLEWALLIVCAILIFNYCYALALLLLRILIPKPAEGYFPRTPDGRPPREALLVMLNLLLVKARFHTPWSAIFTSVIVNIFPLSGLFRRTFGPDTPSVTMGDTYVCMDPYLLKAGRNVQFGFNSVIICHVFDNRGLLLKGVFIDDNAVVGGESTIMPGVTIGNNAVVGSRSLVSPGTTIKPFEFWAGTPARKIRDLSHEQPFAEEQRWKTDKRP